MQTFSVKPEIEVPGTTFIFEKGIVINCTLKRANPPDVNFTWQSCHEVNCSKKSAWKLQSRDQFLRIDDQAKTEVKYRCKARNLAGEGESRTIMMYKKADVTVKWTTSVKTILSVVVPVGIVTIVVVAVMCFVLCKRKKIYGGFYIFSYPPLPDYMKSVDVNGNIQEQLQKLPFIPEWEFPRERISFSK